MADSAPPEESALAALDRGAAWMLRQPDDRFQLQGEDAADLLHRIAASEVRGLDHSELRPVAFTDDKGRLVDVAQIRAIEQGFDIWAGPGRGHPLRAWIDRWIIVEDATWNASGEGLELELYGDDALLRAASALGIDVPDEGQWRASAEAILLRPGAPDRAPALMRLHDPGTRSARQLLTHLREVDAAAAAVWRVTRAVPLPGPALEAGANPLEMGWKPLVSFTKGCYIGQEVVARLDTYDKVKRRLVQIQGRGALPARGEALRADERKRGEVLESVAHEGEVWILALVNTDHEINAELSWNEGAGTVSTVPAPQA